LPITPPTAAPPIVPTALPPVSTDPATAPTPAPTAVFSSRLDIPEQAVKPSTTVINAARIANFFIAFILVPLQVNHYKKWKRCPTIPFPAISLSFRFATHEACALKGTWSVRRRTQIDELHWYVGWRTDAQAQRPMIARAVTMIARAVMENIVSNHPPVKLEDVAPLKSREPGSSFPVVCVGGSAGGLDAYIRLLRNLPADMGVGIVIVNHVRNLATRLHEILPHYTTMPVELITDHLLILPDRVYIIPERRDLHVLDGKFRLEPISKPRGWPDVITVFLRSLTQHWKGKLIAVIVSGYDGDGAAALCGIREVGGITIAQRPDTAGQPDMPESAIASGCVDFVLPAEGIAEAIARIAGTSGH
jgi:hypothetical protein